MERASLLSGSFYVPSNGHPALKILSKRSPFMYLQIPSFSEWLVTLWTNKWLPSSVGPIMHLQCTTLYECLNKCWSIYVPSNGHSGQKQPYHIGTSKWQISCLGESILYHITFACEQLVTLWTRKYLLSFVVLFVCLPMGTSFQVSSKIPSVWMICYNLNNQMASLLLILFMCLPMGSLAKGPATLWTSKRLLSYGFFSFVF